MLFGTCSEVQVSFVTLVSVTAACMRRGALSLLGDFHGVAIVGDWPVFATSQLARQHACEAAHTLHQRVADRSGEILAPFSRWRSVVTSPPHADIRAS